MRSSRLLACAAHFLVVAVAGAQFEPGAVKTAFEPNGDFVLELDGDALEGARLYFSQQAAAYLITDPGTQLSLLLSQRDRAIYAIDQVLTFAQPDGTVEVLTAAVLGKVAEYDAMSQVVFWSTELADGTRQGFKMRPRPWILGTHPPEKLLENSAYAFKAAGTRLDEEAVATLRAVTEDVRVVVYFGSWCPHCQRTIPRVLRLSQELAASRIHFEYYGLPQPMTGDPEAARAGVESVPLAVVSVDGEEKGRLDGLALQKPDDAFLRLLGGS